MARVSDLDPTLLSTLISHVSELSSHIQGVTADIRYSAAGGTGTAQQGSGADSSPVYEKLVKQFEDLTLAITGLSKGPPKGEPGPAYPTPPGDTRKPGDPARTEDKEFHTRPGEDKKPGGTGEPKSKGKKGSAGRRLGSALGGLLGGLIGRAVGGKKAAAKGAQIGSKLGGVVGAAGIAIGAATGIVELAKQFVGALNPALMQQFNQVVANLQATIGSGLTPIIDVAISVLRDAAGELLPLMQQLKPIIEEVASAVGGKLSAVIRSAAMVFESLLPIIQILADSTSEYDALLEDLIGTVGVLIKTIIDTLTALIGGTDLKAVFKEMADQIRLVVRNLVLLAATILKMVGANETLNKLIGNFEEYDRRQREHQQGLVAAFQNPQIKDAQTIAKDLALASAVAGAGGAKPKDPSEFFAEMVGELKAINDGKGLKDVIIDAGTQIFGPNFRVAIDLGKQAIDQLLVWLEKAGNLGQQVKEGIRDSLPAPAQEAFDKGEQFRQRNPVLGTAAGPVGSAVLGSILY